MKHRPIKTTRYIYCLCLVCLGGVLAACLWGSKAPERDFTLEDLLIDLSDLPDGWWEEHPPAPPLEVDGEIIASESIRVIFLASKSPREAVGHRIYRFRYTDTARKEYQNQLEIRFNDPSLTLPEALPYQSDVAESSTFVCGEVTGGESCHFMGVYEEFLVILNVVMRGSINYTELESILETIDHRMATWVVPNNKNIKREE